MKDFRITFETYEGVISNLTMSARSQYMAEKKLYRRYFGAIIIAIIEIKY